MGHSAAAAPSGAENGGEARSKPPFRPLFFFLPQLQYQLDLSGAYAFPA